MHVTHVLYAPRQGDARGEVVRLLQNADIRFTIVEWARTSTPQPREDICLVTSVGEFNSVERVHSYVAQHERFAAVAERISQST